MSNHITNILDDKPVAELTEHELRTIGEHVKTCADCDRAYRAARLATLLVKNHAAEAAESASAPNPFFQTRVLAAWREQQAANREPAWRRLWNSTGALVTSLAVTTAALAVLAFVVPEAESVVDQNIVLSPYSAEAVVLGQSEERFTDEQVLSAMYVEDLEER
jgi:hypothetical protein